MFLSDADKNYHAPPDEDLSELWDLRPSLETSNMLDNFFQTLKMQSVAPFTFSFVFFSPPSEVKLGSL